MTALLHLEPKSSNPRTSTTPMAHPDPADQGLILNTDFSFDASLASLHDGRRKAVSDHVLENGERVVVVDPNVSDDEEQQTGKGPEPRLSVSPTSGQRRKPGQPAKRAAVDQVVEAPCKKMGRTSSVHSLNDSGVDVVGSSPNNVSVPASLLKMLLNAAASSDHENKYLADFLNNSPEWLHALGDTMPSCSKSPKASKESSESLTVDSTTLAKLSSLSSAEQITSALFPNLDSDDLAQRSHPGASALQGSKPVKSESVDSAIRSQHSNGDASEHNATNWLELFKNESSEPFQAIRTPSKRKPGDSIHHLKSSESVLSQLRSRKGQPCAELEELEQFAQHFKRQRIKHGFTQGDVGVALGRRYGTDFSQTTISRFEALNLSFKNMCKLRPLMEEWMNEAEAAISRGATVTDIIEADMASWQTSDGHEMTTPNDVKAILERSLDSKCSPDRCSPILQAALGQSSSPCAAAFGLPALRKRRKRTNLDTRQKEALDAYFNQNSRPDHAKMGEIAAELDLDPDVVRVWFCNRRQKLRKII